MILSDRHIKEAIKNKHIFIDPYNEKYIQPASVDLHLDRYFLVYDIKNNYVIDSKKPIDHMMTEIVIDDNQPFVLHSGDFALGMVHETTGVSSSYVGRLEGKSSVGRMGILIHVTAGFLDPGNSLKMTLELYNTSNLSVMLYYKMPIAQMAFELLSSECDRPYSVKNGGKYVGDLKPKASQMWRNFIKDE